MTLFNEMSMNNINGGSWVFSEESFEAFRNGTRRTTDWNDLIIITFIRNSPLAYSVFPAVTSNKWQMLPPSSLHS